MTRTHNIGRLSADELAEFDDIKADLEALTGRMSRPDCVMKIARWVRRDMQAGRHYSDDVPSIMEAIASESVKVLSNCWHCKYDRSEVVNENARRPEIDACSWFGGPDEDGEDEVMAWVASVNWSEHDGRPNGRMPPRDATGCPGFEPKEQP